MEDIRYFYMYNNETESSCPYCGKELNDLIPSGDVNDFYRCPNCKEDFRVIRQEKD